MARASFLPEDGSDHIFPGGSMLRSHSGLLGPRSERLHDLVDGHRVPGHDLIGRVRIRWCGHDRAPRILPPVRCAKTKSADVMHGPEIGIKYRVRLTGLNLRGVLDRGPTSPFRSIVRVWRFAKYRWPMRQ